MLLSVASNLHAGEQVIDVVLHMQDVVADQCRKGDGAVPPMVQRLAKRSAGMRWMSWARSRLWSYQRSMSSSQGMDW